MLEKIVALAHRAGEEIKRYYGAELAVTTKADRSPLTDADRASHELICETLSQLDPLFPVISEESEDASSKQELQPGEAYWLVDPLDGTKEFLKSTGEFTVNIALVRDRRPILGVVHAPILGLTYLAESGKGAWRQADAAREAIRARPADPNQLWVVASKDHAGPQVAALLAKLPGARLTSMGSSLKFCLVAEGKADLYLRDVPTMEWDTAAAQCVVEEAGGGLFTLDGQRLSYQKNSLKNPAIVTVGDLTMNWREWVNAAAG